MRTQELISKLGVDCVEVLSKSRKANLCNVRHACMYHLYQRGNSLSEIGRRFNRTHATVIHSINKVEDLISIRDYAIIELLIILNTEDPYNFAATDYLKYNSL